MSIQLTNDGGGDVEVVLKRAAAPALSVNKGKIYTRDVTAVTQLFYLDSAGVEYQITPSAGSTSPWTRAGTIVTLSQTGDTEVNPFDDNATVLGTSAKRWNNIVTASNGISMYNAVSGAFAAGRFSASGLSWGTGAIAMDAGLQRGGVGIILVTNPDAGTSGSLYPFVSASGAIGNSSNRWATMAVSSNYSVFATNAAANPTARLASNMLEMGAGGVTAVDIGLSRQSANTFQVSKGTGPAGAGGIVPAVDADGLGGATGILGTPSLRWRTMVTGNLGYNVYNASGDAFSTATLGGGANGGFLNYGPSAVPAAADVGLARSAVNIIDLTDGGANVTGGTLQPGVAGTGKIGTSGTAAAKAFQEVSVTSKYTISTLSTHTNPVTSVESAAIKFGVGGLTPVDVGIERGANNTILLNDGGANSGNLGPKISLTGTVGTASAPFASSSMSSTGFFVYVAAGDANSAANVARDAAGGKIELGAGGLTALDTRIQRTGTKQLRIDDAVGGSVDVVPAVDATSNVGSNLGLGNRRWAQVNAFEVNTGDVVFTDPGCVVCGQPFEEGDDLVMRVIKIHEGPNGRRARTVPAHHGCK